MPTLVSSPLPLLFALRSRPAAPRCRGGASSLLRVSTLLSNRLLAARSATNASLAAENGVLQVTGLLAPRPVAAR